MDADAAKKEAAAAKREAAREARRKKILARANKEENAEVEERYLAGNSNDRKEEEGWFDKDV